MFRLSTGSVISLIGLGLLCMGYSEGINGLIPGVLFLVIGVAILLNKHEDQIEEINQDKE